MKTTAIIGANFGDEGKGLITDFVCNNTKNCIVVRFNGGAQAGHTVVTPTNIRHVFHHFCAGTCTGASTYLSSLFAAHPMLYKLELLKLKQIGYTPKIFVDPNAPITTPYDIILNQTIEQKNKHGSCGVGFNETIERSTKPQYRLTAKDIRKTSCLDQLQEIKNKYIFERFEACGIEIPSKVLALIENDNVIKNFINDIKIFNQYSILETLPEADNLVFEGAQGLLLDMDNKTSFPHVTRSNTGLKNVKKILNEYGEKSLDSVYYVSRKYMTRHGNGPMLHETQNTELVDMTNKENKFQGKLRFGILDLSDVIKRVKKEARTIIAVNKKYLAITCMDQPDFDKCYIDGYLVKTRFKEMNDQIACNGFTPVFSYGANRSKVICL